MKNKKTGETSNTSQTINNKQSEITQTILNDANTCSKCGMVHTGECK